MKIAIGDQYPNDDKHDKSGFLRQARLHQSKYRSEILKVPFDTYGSYLTKIDAKNGLNFYDDFGIFNTVKKRYPNYSKALYANMLRSEHIPFNLFVPFQQNLEYCMKVFNEIMGGCIKSIDRQCILCNKNNIVIEYAPQPSAHYLDDRTSFDTYIEYTHIDNSKGIIGIEVKYTEKEYQLEEGSPEDKAIKDYTSLYYYIMDKSGIYLSGYEDDLISNRYRQIWRNQLLAESIRLRHNNVFKHSSSLTFFPKSNGHFVDASNEYLTMLKEKKTKFIPVTYEKFNSLCRKCSPNEQFVKWTDYLDERYIVTT